ncbi:phosphomannomutase [Yoonia sediminilitoris]|uniref:Phosphomannomutase n=1 Tax=Yoonia sediminilitoris TaxID=1286148 RepID=A0A2T6KH48_9RHOB|nr:phosphomannomutase [Yoonia sediminilitoris]PUB14846.1 phosphomannomutase [Yoonia sediminilitoris]RCW95563.1 phosphomannomutase [Yoonia sediminilitoris]
MAPKFGTSGLRGLVTELTADCITDYINAFVASCDMGTGLFVGHDLRASSPDIANMVAQAAKIQGVDVTACGPVPTPALALAAMSSGAAALMVTGSHIPADRNGLKFYTPSGEITKDDEAAIVAAKGAVSATARHGQFAQNEHVAQHYIDRYQAAFAGALTGTRIGLYAHSAVGRELMQSLLERLGAKVIVLGWSDTFIPVDTEAVDPTIRQQMMEWARVHQTDAIISTDADGDRPLVADEDGRIVVGDVLGQITAAMLGATTVVTPISSNSGVEKSGAFTTVMRTKIGSPYVIAEMQAADDDTVGYEANGGFLLGFDAAGPTGPIAKLMTRDAVLPILCCLASARGRTVSALVKDQPPRFTAADRLQGIASESSGAYVNALAKDAEKRAAFLQTFSAAEAGLDSLDGLRMTLENDRIVHLRPSGNAPEFRLYIEAESEAIADEMLQKGLAALRNVFAAP